MGQDLVRSDRVQRLEAIEEHDHNIHAPHPNRPRIRRARPSGRLAPAQLTQTRRQ
jgi:predicted metal-dependent phosphoesterase TrpH